MGEKNNKVGRNERIISFISFGLVIVFLFGIISFVVWDFFSSEQENKKCEEYWGKENAYLQTVSNGLGDLNSKTNCCYYEKIIVLS